MTPKNLSRILAFYQGGAGLGGLWMLFRTGAGHGSLLWRLLMFAVLGGYFILLGAAGALLGYGRPLGKHLSVYAQWCQVPYLVTKRLTYVLCAPAYVLVAQEGDWFGFTAGLFHIDLAFGRPPAERALGVNLLPLIVVFLVSYGLRSRLQPAEVTEPAA